MKKVGQLDWVEKGSASMLTCPLEKVGPNTKTENPVWPFRQNNCPPLSLKYLHNGSNIATALDVSLKARRRDAAFG